MQAPPIARVRCQCCREGHFIGTYAVRELVVYARKRWHDAERTIAVGTKGRVQRYVVSPMRYLVHVRFKRRGMQPLDLPFAPCELQSSTDQGNALRIVAV